MKPYVWLVILAFSCEGSSSLPSDTAASSDERLTAEEALALAPPDGAKCSSEIEQRNLRLFNERLQLLFAQDPREREYFAPGAVVAVRSPIPYAGTYLIEDGTYGRVLMENWIFGPPANGAPPPNLKAVCNKVILQADFSATARASNVAVKTPVLEIFSFRSDGKILRDDFFFLRPGEVTRALLGR
jgi:hypothetical protein